MMNVDVGGAGDSKDSAKAARAAVGASTADRVTQLNAEAERLSLTKARLRPVDQISVVVEAIDLPVAVAAVDVFRRDLNGPWRSDPRDVALEVQIVVEYLDAPVAAIRDVDMTIPRRDGMHGVELAVTAAERAVLLQPGAP